MSKNPVVHFEMPYTDGKRVSEFYQKAFGWNMIAFPGMGDYITAETAASKDGRPAEVGAINGGLYPQSSAPDSREPSVVVAVEDIAKAMQDVVAAGGKCSRIHLPMYRVWVYTRRFAILRVTASACYSQSRWLSF